MTNTFVSRGGIKLEHALKEFNVDISGLTVLDVGSSTGGFVDCLLRRGAKKVYSVDTAYGELAWKLRTDPRVVVMERENVLFLESLPETVDLITIDLSFTPLIRALPVVKKFGDKIIALVKPQYEDQRLALKHHGVIPENLSGPVLDSVKSFVKEAGFQILGQIHSPILGGEGNKEFFLYLHVQN